MWLPLELTTANIGMSLEYLIPLLAFICGLTFFAVNFKLGTVLMFLINGAIFMWFYQQELNYVPALVLMFIMLVMMAFSLFAVHERDATGGRLT